jgi:AcrR family transcriptional regulator
VETIPGHLERLPEGGDRFKAELLSHDPRQRILFALAELVAKRGYHGTTIERVVKRAGVSRATFYENFENREDCLLACVAEAESEVTERISEAVAEAPDWPGQVRAALVAFIDFVGANPALARTCLVESVSVGPMALERYEQALRGFAPLFRSGRKMLEGDGELPETLEDMIVGGVVWMVRQRLLRGEVEQLPELLPTMLEFALAPYLGEARAAEIAARS